MIKIFQFNVLPASMLMIALFATTDAQESAILKEAVLAPSALEIELFDQQIVDRGRGMTQVFLIGEEKQVHIAGKAMPIEIPKGVETASLAYCRIYFVGRAGKVDKGIVVLIANYDTDDPKFFIDQNNDLDFSNDENSAAKRDKDGSFLLRLHGDHPDSTFTIQLMPFRGDKTMTRDKREKYRQMFQGLEDYMGGEFADAEYWYYNRRLNSRTSSVEVDGQKTMIGLHDYDCDGLYSGNRDRLIVGKYGDRHISFALSDGAINVVPGEIFMIGETPFCLVDAAENGSCLRIAKSEKMPQRLFVGSKVPEMTLKSFDGTSVELWSLIESDKLLVLDFWGHWCGPCVAAIPTSIEFQEKWKDRLTVVGIHNGDQESARELIRENEIPFPQFDFSDELEEMFFVDAWPSYVVISDEGKLLSFKSSFKKIVEMLEKNN